MELIFVYEAVPLGVLFCSGDPGQEYLNHGGVKHVFVSDRASFRAVHIFLFSPFSNVLGPAAGGGLAPPPRRWFQWSFKDAEMGISQAALGSARGTQQDGGGGGGGGGGEGEDDDFFLVLLDPVGGDVDNEGAGLCAGPVWSWGEAAMGPRLLGWKAA